MASMTWEFSSEEIADLVIDTLLKVLRNEGFYIQIINIENGHSQARKGDIVLFITEKDNAVTIETVEAEMQFVKTAVYEVIVALYESVQKLKESSNPQEMKKELSAIEIETHHELLSYITPNCTFIGLKGETKEEVITELVDLLAGQGRLLDRDTVLMDVWEREGVMNTGMERGIALPHAKTDGVDELVVAVGIKKEGVAFGSVDGEKSRIFVMMLSPKRAAVPYLEFLAAIGTALTDDDTREAVINAGSAEIAVSLLQEKRNEKSGLVEQA